MNHTLTDSDQQILSHRQTRFFIILMCLIRQHQLTTSEQLENALSAMPSFPRKWQQIARDLFAASQDGEERFWRSYDFQAIDYPPLAQWRSLVAQTASLYLNDDPPSSSKPSVVTSLQDTPDPDVNWLWRPRIPLGMLTLLDGDPDLGTLLLPVDLAARISRGLPMPDGSPGLPAAAGVILIMPEDDSHRTVRHRLLQADADLNRVFTINQIPVIDPTTGYTYHRTFSLPDDLPRLEQAIDQAQARLLILDPTALLFGNKDTCKQNEAFILLSLLSALLTKKQVACVLLRHPGKGISNNALSHALRSIASIGLPRTELMIVNDSSDEQMSLLVHIKSNIGELAPTLKFSLSSSDSHASIDVSSAYIIPSASPTPSVSWLGTSSYSPQQALLAFSTLSIEAKPASLRTAILRILQQNTPKTFSPLEMAKLLPHVPLNTLQVTLRRLANDKQIEQPLRGQYCLTFPPSQNHSDA